MGRKIEIKMIENATRRQVTYSKRRTSLIKKAHELSVFCDIDVLLLVFSPSRRVSAYCSRTSLEDLLERFISLPTVKKYEKNPNMKNVAEKLERLKGIESIAGDENKLHYLKNRINHLELQAKKFKIDLELLSASIRDFEPPIEEEDPMAQAKLCLRSLKISLQKLADRKNVLLGNRASFVNGQPSTGDFLGTYDDMRKLTETADEDLLLACNFGGVELGGRRQNRSTTRLIRQLDPWLSPYSNKARERILEGASVKHGNRVNAHSRFPQPVPTFPSIPPPPKYFPAPLQPQSPRVKNNYVLPPRPPPPPYDQAHRQRARDSSFWRQLPMPTDWMTPPPSARYNQQQQHGASEKLFMSYSNRKNGEGSSSQFLTNRNDQSCKNQNNVVGALTSPFQANQGDKVNCFIGDDGNITLPQNINPRITSLGTNEPLVISSAPSASKNDNSPVVFTVNDDSSNLIGEILSQHQLCINNEYSGEVHKANDNATVDGHVGDFLSQHQPKDNGKSNNNSNEVTEENEKNTSPNIDEFLAIQDFETELISLDALFEEIEKMAGEEAGNQVSGSKEWDGFALAESLNSSNFNIIN